jgi:transketolase
MHQKNLLDDIALASYCRDGSPYGAHPEFGAPGIDVGTGSLGQGLSVACGIALSRRMRRSPGRVFALLSDAECNEGQVWEAAQFAAHHRLGNLVAIVDFNGMQAMGKTTEILDLSPLPDRWRAFGWHAVDVDGHDVNALANVLDIVDLATSSPPGTPGGEDVARPTVVVARTKLGHGVSFMENRLEWHYRPLTDELAGRALAEAL